MLQGFSPMIPFKNITSSVFTNKNNFPLKDFENKTKDEKKIATKKWEKIAIQIFVKYLYPKCINNLATQECEQPNLNIKY